MIYKTVHRLINKKINLRWGWLQSLPKIAMTIFPYFYILNDITYLIGDHVPKRNSTEERRNWREWFAECVVCHILKWWHYTTNNMVGWRRRMEHWALSSPLACSPHHSDDKNPRQYPFLLRLWWCCCCFISLSVHRETETERKRDGHRLNVVFMLG